MTYFLFLNLFELFNGYNFVKRIIAEVHEPIKEVIVIQCGTQFWILINSTGENLKISVITILCLTPDEYIREKQYDKW